MNADFILSRTFTFEAAHSLNLPGATSDGYTRLHGHSFTCILSVKGKKNDTNDWLLDLGSLDPVIKGLRDTLDHSYLNDIKDLGAATLENLCAYIFKAAAPDVKGLYAVELQRLTCGQSCKLVMNT